MSEKMSKRLPSTINIIGHIFSVEEVDQVTSGGSVLWGEISYDNRTIKVSTKEPCKDPRVVLVHEIIHGVCDEGGIDLDEANVTRLANILCDTLERNGLLK